MLYQKNIEMLDTICATAVNTTPNFSYLHEIVWYGFEAIALHIVMRDALQARSAGISAEALAEKYRIHWVGPERKTGLVIHGSTLREAPVYLPAHLFDHRFNSYSYTGYQERIVTLCGEDTKNRYWHNEQWQDTTQIERLTDHVWQLSDLADPSLLSDGVAVSRQLLKACKYNYYHFDEYEENGKNTEPKELYALGEELLASWEAFVSGND